MGGKGSGRKAGFKNPKSRENLRRRDFPPQEYLKPSVIFAREMMDWEEIDLNDVEALKKRFDEYLELCARHEMRPMVIGMAQAFGIGKAKFVRIGLGDDSVYSTKLTDSSRNFLKKCYQFCALVWENFLAEEKGNPVKWIFYGKNFFQMRDQMETIVRHEDTTPRLGNTDEIGKRYAEIAGFEPAQLPAVNVEPEIIEPVEQKKRKK